MFGLTKSKDFGAAVGPAVGFPLAAARWRRRERGFKAKTEAVGQDRNVCPSGLGEVCGERMAMGPSVSGIREVVRRNT